jgi:hypothetical protein
VDQDDPEKRIAELPPASTDYIQPHSGWAPGLAQGPQFGSRGIRTEANAASETRRGLWSVRGIAHLLISIVFVGLGLYFLGDGVRGFYGYQLGTPTTASIDHCEAQSRSRTCYATWSVGGESRTGPIEGGNRWDYRIGSSVDVRVSGGTAYTAATVPTLEILGGALQIALGVGGLRILRRRRNR